MTDIEVKTEREMNTALLRKYKELPCLWNTSHEHYGVKEIRKNSWAELVQIYRCYKPQADACQLKKKIENMRTSFHREYKKVLKARMRGEEYLPVLWYYKLISFVSDEDLSSEYVEEESSIIIREDSVLEKYLRSDASEEERRSPVRKKSKPSNIVYLDEDHLDDSYSINLDQSNSRQGTSADAFGRTVGMQLGELHPMQRFIAEKLISDVIFYGRLEKLTSKTQLSNSDIDEKVPF